MAQVLLVTNNFPSDSGGINKLMEYIAEYSEHEIDVLSYQEFYDESFKFNVIYGDYGGYTGLLKLFFDLSIKFREYDVLYFDKPDDAWTGVIAKMRGKKIISHSHGSETYTKIVRLRSYLRKWLFDFSVRLINKFIAVSNFTKERLIKRGAESSEVEVVHNGVEFDRFNDAKSINRDKLGIPEDVFVVLTVSRLAKRKGHALVIEAIKDLDNVYYLVVGSGNTEDKLRNQAEKLNISERVIFTGYVEDSDLPAYYSMADIFAMPSQHMGNDGGTEGFPLVFLEANASGLPVIGSRAGGSPDAIKDSETGFLAKTSSEDVREKILQLKEDDELRSEMEDNAVEWAREHNWPIVIDEIDEIIEKSV